MDLTATALKRAITTLRRTIEGRADDNPPCLAEQLLRANDRPRPAVARGGQSYELPSAGIILHFYRQAQLPAPWWTRWKWAR